MIKRMFILVIFLAVVAIIATQAGYGLFESNHQGQPLRDPDITEQVPDSADDGGAMDDVVYKTRAVRSQPLAGGSDLHQRLLTMTEPEKNQVLYLVLRDSGARCGEVMSSQNVIAESSVWHVHCENLHNYSVVIDALGSISVHPIPYEDISPEGLPERLPQ